MMQAAKFIVFPLLLCALPVQVAWSNPADDSFSTIDFDSILANRILLSSFVKCLIDRGPCTLVGEQVKRVLPEVVRTSCSICSPQQRNLVRHVITIMKSKYNHQWNLIVDKYDPERRKAGELKAFLAATD